MEDTDRVRAFLQHDYGVHPGQIEWKMGGLEQPGREERAAFELSRQLSKTGFACDTFDAALRHIESFQQLCIQRRVVRPANQEYLGIQLLHQPSCQFPVAIQRPAFGRQFHAWIAAAARQQCYLHVRRA